MRTWTPEQQQAIFALNHTILVSAAAGSGKTSVLIERIVQLIREGYSISRMLIVTFTRAAASEMRQRLNERLIREAQKYPESMSDALDELETCEISTIHAFCQRLLRNEFQTVGVDPLFRICEENERKNLFELAFCDAMNQLLDEGDNADFMALADAYNQQTIRDMVDSLHKFIMSMAEPFTWLDQHIQHVTDEPFTTHPWYHVLVSEAKRRIYGMGDLLEAQRRMFDEENAVQALQVTWLADMDAYQKILMKVDVSRETFYEHVASFEFVRAATCRGLNDAETQWKKRYTDLRKQMKDLIEKIKAYLSFDPAKMSRELSVIQQHLRGLKDLILLTEENFRQYKQAKNVVDFGDLEQLTYEVLSHADLRGKIQHSFDHIFVDECQDVSAIQDSILQAIHGENSCLFMVGDVKQSIYRFRLADPTRFLSRMRSFSDDENAWERRIFLQKNFRSREAVLDATNRIFRRLMRRSVTELDYLPEDELIPGRETENDPPVELYVLDSEDSDEGEPVKPLEAEAMLVVERIRELLETPYPGQNRRYTYRDMVILLPKAAGVGAKLVEILSEQGIPVYFDGADSYYALPEIVTMKSLLSVIDNPLQDIALMAVLKAMPFGLTDEALAAIRLCKTGRGVPFHEAFSACCQEDSTLGRRCQAIEEQLKQWRFESEVMRLSDFLWQLMRTSGFYASCGALPKGELRQANLRLLCQRAATYEANGGCSLRGFLALTDQQQQADDQQSAKLLGENENLVRLMTMHKSKGLEFPIVFCLQLSNKLHLSNRSSLKMHNALGVCLPYVLREMNITRPTLGDEAFSIQKKLDEKAERARLLYVAMTRAKERLILIGSTPKNKRGCWYLPENDYRIDRAESMTDWLMQAILSDCPDILSTCYPQSGNPWNIRLRGSFERSPVENKKVIHSPESSVIPVEIPPAGEQLWTKWGYVPPKQSDKPLKTSVSSLIRKETLHDPLPLSDEDESIEDKRQEETIVNPLRLSELPARPAFLESRQASGAQHGTLMHRVLSLIPLDALSSAENLGESLHESIHQMVHQGMLRSDELFRIPLPQLVQFYASDIGQRLLKSPVIRREWSFNLLLSEGTLLQGVIDCAFMENNQWILLDYKTDRIIEEEAFVARYRDQLRWYARALTELTGYPVAETWLYSLSLGKAFSAAETKNIS